MSMRDYLFKLGRLRPERFKLVTSQVGVGCVLSPVAKEMMSNTFVAIHDIVQVCSVGFLIQIK